MKFTRNILVVLVSLLAADALSGCVEGGCRKVSDTKYRCSCSMGVVDEHTTCSANVEIAAQRYAENPFAVTNCQGRHMYPEDRYLYHQDDENSFHNFIYSISGGVELEASFEYPVGASMENCWSSVPVTGGIAVQLANGEAIEKGQWLSVDDERFGEMTYYEYVEMTPDMCDIGGLALSRERVFESTSVSGSLYFESLQEPPIIIRLDVIFSDEMGLTRQLSGSIELDSYMDCGVWT